MSSSYGRWLGYGFGAAIGRALFGESKADENADGPVRKGTEADFREDEKRFDADQKRIEADADDAKKGDRRKETSPVHPPARAPR